MIRVDKTGILSSFILRGFIPLPSGILPQPVLACLQSNRIYDRDRGSRIGRDGPCRREIAAIHRAVAVYRAIEQLAYIGGERLRYAETPEEDTLCCPRPIGPS